MKKKRKRTTRLWEGDQVFILEGGVGSAVKLARQKIGPH